MAKKILLAAGCSYTDAKYYSFDEELPEEKRGGWAKWPEIMANALDLECVNVGRCGAGASHIFNATVKHLAMYGDRVDTVAVLWSGADRQKLYNYNLNPLVEIDYDNPKWRSETGDTFDPFVWMDEIGFGKFNRNFWQNKNFNKKVYYSMIDNQLIQMLSLIEICHQRGIKVIMGQGLTFFDFYTLEYMKLEKRINDNAFIHKKEVYDYLLKSPLFSSIQKHKKNIIGWPFYHELGGTNFERYRFEKEEYFISKRDRHPNKECQELWANVFIKEYRKIYG